MILSNTFMENDTNKIMWVAISQYIFTQQETQNAKIPDERLRYAPSVGKYYVVGADTFLCSCYTCSHLANFTGGNNVQP